jgi:hypothetical protein
MKNNFQKFVGNDFQLRLQQNIGTGLNNSLQVLLAKPVVLLP